MFGGAAGGRGGASYGGSRYGNPYEEPPTPQRGDDRKSKITLTFRQAVKGATVSLRVDGKQFKTHIPAGVKDGQKIRIAGKGRPGSNGGANGDMYLTVQVKPDLRFTMRGHDIVMDVPVTVGEAVAGARVEAHDIDGETVTFKVPAGSSSGAEIRVSGKGVQSATAGDLIGCVQIRVPAKPGLGAKHAAKEFDKSVEGYAEAVAAER